VWSWGGTTLPADRIVPTQVSGLGVIIAISLSSTHALALRDDGTVWAWGRNDHGSLGHGSTAAYSNTPVQVSNLNGVMKVFAGPDTSYAILYDGTAWAWGRNAWAQLGDGTTTTRRTPVQVSGLNDVVSIAGGISFGMAVRADGSGWSWGSDHTTSMATRQAVNFVPVRMAVEGLIDVTASNNTGMAVTANGQVWAGGNLAWDLASDGSWYMSNLPTKVPVITSGVTSLAVGVGHAMAVQPDGTVWSWGDNLYGQLGRGQPDGVLVPSPSLLD
jgi:alpha-tubulin suppressor-like RCC1 family protein